MLACTARTVVAAVTTAGERMCVIMKMGRVQMDVTRGIEGTNVTQVNNQFHYEYLYMYAKVLLKFVRSIFTDSHEP